MKFLLDESTDFRIGAYLCGKGHDVTAISRDYPQALRDDEVLAIATRENRILIARDRDFRELIFRQGLQHNGVILIRLGPTRLDMACRALDQIVSGHATDVHQFIVVTEYGIRIRRSPGSEH